MDVQRAQTILQSPEKITVQYRNQAVWIEDVDTSTKTATVHPEKDESDRQVVEVEQLHEVQM